MGDFPPDFIRIHGVLGAYDLPIKECDFDWPPPEFIYLTIDGRVREKSPGDNEFLILERTNMSILKEKVRHVARGAEYRYIK